MNEDKFNLPKNEEEVLKFWEDKKIFEKTLEATRRGKPFVFYEGPPTANGLPHIGHALTRAFKDIILRYKTMRGFYVPRRAGWDTHGLPVEIEVEKALGLKTKQDIERYGVAKFNQKAKESVWRYKDEWERVTKRLGFWIDMPRPYITYETTYIETLWWIIKRAWEKKLLYQDFKVVPWCSRCQTGLSTHELGQPGAYKKIREDSIFVKLKIRGRKNEYLLIWTTTPWTLPANVAVALDPKLEYTKYKLTTGKQEEYIWSLKTPPYESGVEVEVVERVLGKRLLGLSYEPMFRVRPEYSLGISPPYITIAADFILTDEGTGMVHIAPAFGDEDMGAIKSQTQNPKSQINSKSQIQNFKTSLTYPILCTVNLDGTMKKGIVGAGKFVKNADQDIAADLKKRGLLYKIVSYEHEYPHCWRCQTPLLYFAKNCWWIRMSSLKDKLIKNNQTVNWIPQHIQSGRFGEFLNEVRDWAFSRERYWGTPLPIWKCASCNNTDVVSSREELSKLAGAQRNRYFLTRHGESRANIAGLVSYKTGDKLHETLRGVVQDERAARRLTHSKIDLVFSSDLTRTKETAQIVARALGIKKIYFDRRIREINTGIFGGRQPSDYRKYFSAPLEKFYKRPPQGENLGDVRSRMLNFLEDLEKKYLGKNILIISHEYPLWMLYTGALGMTNKEALAARRGKRAQDFIHFAEIMELTYNRLPRDETGEVNLHRPYVDSLAVPCRKCGQNMKRVIEIADVWFDSGAMPFAQAHFPFSQKENGIYRYIEISKFPKTPKGFWYPADYICEGVDQTRGWFYTLLAVATLLSRGAPYKNVISLGHVLDKNGQKMSKSKGNVVDPKDLIVKYGGDAMRWYFYTINDPGEPKRFDEKDLFNKLKGFLGVFWNSLVFFDTYVAKTKTAIPPRAKNLLDRWVLVKLDRLTAEVTKSLDRYDVASAARSIEYFMVNDFSQWYLRRSRTRFQHPRSRQEKDVAAGVTFHVLLTLCKIAAPFIPFLTEAVFQRLRKKAAVKDESVHLLNWPTKFVQRKEYQDKILKEMEWARGVVSDALKKRAEAGIKIRQPLAALEVKKDNYGRSKELLDLVKAEVNVKEIRLGEGFVLDTRMTPELKEEGLVRELVRNVQEMRKDLGLKPKDIITIQIQGDPDTERIISKWSSVVRQDTNSKAIRLGGKKVFKVEREINLGGSVIWTGITGH